MPKLRTKDILDFRNDSGKIKPNEVFPILSYLKIEFKENYCCLTKNGLSSFVKKNIPADCKSEDGTILVDELKLFNFAEAISTDSFEITSIDNKIKLKASLKATLATDDLAKFPINDIIPSEWHKLYIEHLMTIGTCVAFIEETSEKSMHLKTHIFCKNNTIVASNGNIAFYKKVTDPIPEMIIRREVGQAISGFQGAEYASNDSYDFFRSENLLYGFSKSESKFYDLSTLGKIESNDKSFAINKDELIKYNNACIKSTNSKIINTIFRAKSSTELELIFNDPDSGVDEFLGTVEIKDGSGEFKYNPQIMNNLLLSIPATICYFYPGKNKYYVTDELQSFVSLIMGVI